MDMAAPRPEEKALRAEHDRLASRLAARASVDDFRRALYATFLFVITGGLSAKLAYDRWGPYRRGPAVLLFLAVGAALACVLVAVASWVRGHRKAVDEDAAFERLRDLRARLGIDT
jgi:hypothetical protein